ncbi:MAG: RDD family protein [Planctomycetes bacterium]|nr:RDD family protein [Planctomycetota bacterium]
MKNSRSAASRAELPLAPLGLRFAAVVLDALLLLMLAQVVPVGVMAATVFAESAGVFRGSGVNFVGALYIVIGLIVWGMVPIYEGLMLQMRGQTLGKMALKIKVVTVNGGDISRGQAWIRALVKGCFWPLWYLQIIDFVPGMITEQKTCLHDMAAKTRVIVWKR